MSAAFSVVLPGPEPGMKFTRQIGAGAPCFVVAEIGQNHNGSTRIANDLWRAAFSAGVDAVKFTKRDIESDMTSGMRDMPYHGPHSFGDTYGDHRSALELSVGEHAEILARAEYNRWPLCRFFTACDIASVRAIESSASPSMYKIASRDADNVPLIDAVLETGKPIIMSSGMSSIDDLAEPIRLIQSRGVPLVVLHCVSIYPTQYKEMNLRRMLEIRDRYDVLVGLSDHTGGIALGAVAVAMGACVLEYHLTLSRMMRGSDHAASLEQNGMRKLVEYVRATEAALKPSAPDCSALAASRRKLGRSLTATRDILAGSVVSAADMCLKSPGHGLRWRDMPAGSSYVAVTDINKDETVLPGFVSPGREQHGEIMRVSLPCGVVSRAPVGVSISDADVKTHDFLSRHSTESRFRLGVWRWKGLAARFLELNQLAAELGRRVLDFGGAAAPITQSCVVVDTEKHTVHGELVAYQNLLQVACDVESGTRPPFRLLFSSHTLEHCADHPETVLADLRRCAAPGALLVLHVPGWTCRRWRAGNYANNKFSDHRWTFQLADDLPAEWLANVVNIDEAASKSFEAVDSYHCGDDSILVTGSVPAATGDILF